MQNPETNYYAILAGLKRIPYDSLENALAAGPLYVVKEMYNHTHKTRFGNEYRCYNYQVLDPRGNDVKLKVGNWGVSHISRGEFIYIKGRQSTDSLVWDVYGAGNHFSIADANGTVMTKPFLSWEDLFEFLQIASEYKTWQEFSLKEENEAMAKEIDRLKAQLAKLTGQLDSDEVGK